MPTLDTLKSWPGFKQARVSQSYGGLLVWWDVERGAPVKADPEGRRWCIEHYPEGRGKRRRMYVSTKRASYTILRKIAEGEDEWGFWKAPKSEKKAGAKEKRENVSRNGSQQKPAPGGGGDPLEDAAHPPANSPQNGDSGPPGVAGNGLGQTIQGARTPEQIANGLIEMMDATKPIYVNDEGNVKKVGGAPDWPTREKGYRLWLNYGWGLPVKRKEEEVRHHATEAEVVQKIATKPGYRRGLKNYINAIERQEKENLDEMRRAKGSEEGGGSEEGDGEE